MPFAQHPDDAFVTAGERYRTPAHPAMIEALGRAMWNALSLDQQIIAILHESGDQAWQEAQRLTAGLLERKLRQFGAAHQDDAPGVAEAVRQAADAYAAARSNYRNALAHAGAYTASTDELGRPLPGLVHHPRSGGPVMRFESPGALLQVAREIEDAIDPIGEARIVVRVWRSVRPSGLDTLSARCLD